MTRDDNSNKPEQPTAPDTSLGALAEVRILNDDETPMEFVVWILESLLITLECLMNILKPSIRWKIIKNF